MRSVQLLESRTIGSRFESYCILIRDHLNFIMMFSNADLNQALAVLGDLLLDRGERHELVVIGGGGLLLLDLVRRPTKDLDVVARVQGELWIASEPLPASLVAAVHDVAGALDLPLDWLNAGPSDFMRTGLPEGFRERTTPRVYGGLTLQLASRLDQLALKLFAAADQGPRSRHFADLRLLRPTAAELNAAAGWCRAQDSSELWGGIVDEVLQALTTKDNHDGSR